MIFPTAGQTITVNFDIEIEEEDGYIHRVDAGEELLVVGYDDLAGRNMTPEQYFEEYGSIELMVEVGDITVQNQWDRSGQSDYEINGGVQPISLDEESGIKIIR
jgi:hypothetical protein